MRTAEFVVPAAGMTSLNACKRNIAIHRQISCQAERADTAHRVAGQRNHCLGIKHLGLAAQCVLDLLVINTRIATGHQQYILLTHAKGQGLGNLPRFNAMGFSRQATVAVLVANSMMCKSGALAVKKARTDSRLIRFCSLGKTSNLVKPGALSMRHPVEAGQMSRTILPKC